MKDKTVFRVEKNPNNPFVMIDRRPIENPVLSWKAKGLLAYLLSRPDDWVVQFRDLVKRSSDGAHTVREAMKELRKSGHVRLMKEYEGGRIKRWVYQVYEVPILDSDFQQVEKLEVENRAINNKKLTKNKLTDIKDAPAPKIPKLPKEAKPKAADFPAVVVFTSVTKPVTERYPARINWDEIVQYMDKVTARLGHFPTVEELAPFYQAWCRRGWNRFAIDWLDYAVRGVLPIQGSRPPISAPPVEPPVYSQADRELRDRELRDAILAARVSR